MSGRIELGSGVWTPRGALRFTASRSGGAGGQHVNRTASRVSLHLAIASIVGLDDDQRQRLIALAGTRCTSDGILVMHADRHREQPRNREDCLQRLRDLIARALYRPRTRKDTKPTRGAVRRRLDGKRQTGERKRRRRDSGRQDGW